jgi:preprotein translocase subunit SecY
MPEKKKSRLYVLKPLVDRMPAVTRPDGHVHFKTKIIWTGAILIIYFAMTNIFIYGLNQATVLDTFAGFRAILAGASGSIMHLGIGPIVTGSIIMQLFTGAKIIGLDLTKAEDKAIYQNTQKLIVIIMIIVEAVPQVYGMLSPSSNLVTMLDTKAHGYGDGLAKLIIIVQLCIGSYLVFLMDEVVSKWGIGSGISLFIAAGVAESTITGSINWIPVSPGQALSISNPPAGTIPKTLYFIQNMPQTDLTRGGYEVIFIQNPNPIIAMLGTMAVFMIVVYFEAASIELPLAHGKVRGARGRYPIRLIYASNIPVILMSALLANINMFALLLWQHPTLEKIPLIGHQRWLGWYQTATGATQASTVPQGGAVYYCYQVGGVQEWLLPLMNWDKYSAYTRGHEYWQVIVHIIVYLAFMIYGSMKFAEFWISTTGMDSESIAKQIKNSGMVVPGFRRDPRVLGRVLDRYIPTVTVFSGAFVGLLAAMADMIGTVGNASGTGVLLMAGIMIRTYEQLAKEQMMEMHPLLRGLFGHD